MSFVGIVNPHDWLWLEQGPKFRVFDEITMVQKIKTLTDI